MRKLRILAGGAESLFCDLKKATLGFWGCEVLSVSNGKQACAALLAQQVDLCFFDWDMPKMSALETCQWVRLVDMNQPYVVLLTEKDKPEQLRAAYLAGADDYMVKPFSPEDLRFLVSMRAQSVSQKYRRQRKPVRFEPLEQYRRDLTGSTKTYSRT